MISRLPHRFLVDPTLLIKDGHAFIQHRDRDGALLFNDRGAPIMKDVTPVGVAHDAPPAPPPSIKEANAAAAAESRDLIDVMSEIYNRMFAEKEMTEKEPKQLDDKTAELIKKLSELEEMILKQVTVLPPASKSDMRRFVLRREEDVSGTSGTGVVAEGVVFSNGTVALTWITHLQSVAFYQSLDVLEKVHGHGGKTVVIFVDEKKES